MQPESPDLNSPQANFTAMRKNSKQSSHLRAFKATQPHSVVDTRARIQDWYRTHVVYAATLN
jgi:hypothetical protein